MLHKNPTIHRAYYFNMIHKSTFDYTVAICYDKYIVRTSSFEGNQFPASLRQKRATSMSDTSSRSWISVTVLHASTSMGCWVFWTFKTRAFHSIHTRHGKLSRKDFDPGFEFWGGLLEREVWRLYEVHEVFEFCSLGICLGFKRNLHSFMKVVCDDPEILLIEASGSHCWCPNADTPRD